MATANDIITDALIRIGVYSMGESISDADAERCLSILNDMLDSWSNESLSCYAILEQSTTLTVGKSAYTIGSGGDVNVTRPLRLIDGPGAGYIQDTLGNNFQLDIYPRDKWNLLSNRTSTTQSNIPTVLFYDPQYPLGTLNFWPQPNLGGYTAFWDSYLQLTSFANLAASMSFPPGYKDALQKNLAIEIWPDFKEGDPPAFRMKQAGDAKGNIKRTNLRPTQAAYDPELIARGVATYNWQNDSVSGRN